MTDDKRSTAELGSQGKKVLLALWRIERLAADFEGRDLRITAINVRAPRSEGEDWLVTIKAETEDQKRFVGFNGSPSLAEALMGAQARFDNGQIKWKEDNWQGKG